METENKAVLISMMTDVVAIVNITIMLGKYISISCAERMTKISQGSIGDCLHGRRKTAGGYLWQYEK